MPDFGESGLSPSGTLLAPLDVLALPNVLDPPKGPKLGTFGVEIVRCPLLILEPPNTHEGEAFIVVVFWPKSGSPLPTQFSSSSSFSSKGENPLALVLEDIESATRSSTQKGMLAIPYSLR